MATGQEAVEAIRRKFKERARSPQKEGSYGIDNLYWTSDFLSIPTIIRKRGSSLYLLLPAPIVQSLGLRDGQKATITILTAERGARIGLFIDLGTPKISAIFYEVEFIVEPFEIAQEIINKIANVIPIHFISIKAKEGKAKCILKFTSRDPGFFFEVRNTILREAKKNGAKLSFLNINQEEAKFVPLDLSLLKEVIKGVEGYELIWE